MMKVVAGIIVKDGRLLLAKRKMRDGKEGWEFPGGKIEEGEKPEAALIREIEEELDMRVNPLDVISVKELVGESGERMVFYAILAKAEEESRPVAREHEELRWVSPEEIKNFDLFEPDRLILEELTNFFAFLK